MATYPNMQANAQVPVASGDDEPFWQALTTITPPLANKRILALHVHSGWFCRYAMNHGAASVLGIDSDSVAISQARLMAATDRLRYRIMPDWALTMLTGAYDLIVGTFDLGSDDLNLVSHQLVNCLRPGGQLVATVSAPPTPPSGPALTVTSLIDPRLTIDAWQQVVDPRLASEHLHFMVTSRVKRRRP